MALLILDITAQPSRFDAMYSIRELEGVGRIEGVFGGCWRELGVGVDSLWLSQTCTGSEFGFYSINLPSLRSSHVTLSRCGPSWRLSGAFCPSPAGIACLRRAGYDLGVLQVAENTLLSFDD